MRCGSAWVLSVLLALLPPASLAQERRELDLSPPDKAAWGLRNVGIGLLAFLGGWKHWYGENGFRLETVPADAGLALYYIRGNFQRRFERTKAPIFVKLPRRVDATSRDAVSVRVTADGYLAEEITFRVHDAPAQVLVELSPLPNSLVFLGHTHLGGRSTLTFRTKEEPQYRVTRSRASAGFTLSLSETANKLEFVPSFCSGHVKSVQVTQVESDLLVRVEAAKDDVEVRSKRNYDPIRQEHVFVLEIMEEGALLPSAASIRRSFDRVEFSLDDQCHAAFEQQLRADVDAEALSRGLRQPGTLAALYLREAMLHLGRLRSGTVRNESGETLRTGSPIELEIALRDASSVRGYLGLLGAFVRNREAPAQELRSLIAPEMGAAEFEPIYASAETAWRSCQR